MIADKHVGILMGQHIFQALIGKMNQPGRYGNVRLGGRAAAPAAGHVFDRNLRQRLSVSRTDRAVQLIAAFLNHQHQLLGSSPVENCPAVFRRVFDSWKKEDIQMCA